MSQRVLTTVDPQGGLFVPIPGKGLRPAYSYGPKGKGQTRDVMFQCPVSAIPNDVWTLLELWWQCRLLGTLPVAGGLLDQPAIVRYAFPFFEGEMRRVDAGQASGTAANAAALALGAVFGKR